MSPSGDARRQGLMNYQGSRLTESDYRADEQFALKQRAFDTFDTLLRFCGRTSMEPGQVLVDLGAGDGMLVRVAAAARLKARGVDAADGVDFERDNLPFADGSVDVVTALSVIEHLRDSSIFLAEVRRILKPGGAFILVTPNWRYSQSDFFDDPTHVHPFSPVSLQKLLRFQGFVDPFLAPWIVKKPTWIWGLSWRFRFARWFLPFRGDAPAWIPGFLKGQSRSILAVAFVPDSSTGNGGKRNNS